MKLGPGYLALDGFTYLPHSLLHDLGGEVLGPAIRTETVVALDARHGLWSNEKKNVR